jgi:hypothetical protein
MRDGKAVLVVAVTDTSQLISIEIHRDGTLSVLPHNRPDLTDEWLFSDVQVADARAWARQYCADNPDEIRRLLEKAYGPTH